MMTETIAMSTKEIDRLHVLQRLNEGLIKQKQAATMLGISTRQTRTLLKDYKRDGPAALVSKRRGKTSNRAYSEDIKNNAISIIKNNYADFGPTLACEYLLERHQIVLGIETVRRWMIKDDVWQAKKRKVKIARPPRLRRAHYGELIQIDGSQHDWFEGRSEYCTLLVFIDDATSKVQLARFFPAETTFAYFTMIRLYIERYGKPLAIYSDKHSIFKVNIIEPAGGTGFTQFGRAMQDIDVELIYAHSAPAKGRVERMNGTLQDRLIKWLRIEGISDPETANQNMDRFTDDLNNKFAVPPRAIEDLHRGIDEKEYLRYVFTLQTKRAVSKNLTIQYKNKTYAIKVPGKGYRLRQAKVTVCEAQSGEITLLHNNKSLSYEVYDKNQHYSEPVTAKELPLKLKHVSNYKPDINHPWKKISYDRLMRLKSIRHQPPPPTQG